jgi:hypothetical protein
VLTEVVSLFLTAAIQIFGERQDPPEKIKICFGLTREEVDVANKGTTYELSAHPINQFGSYPGRKASPAEDRIFWIDFTLERCCPQDRGFEVIEGNLPLVRNYG